MVNEMLSKSSSVAAVLNERIDPRRLRVHREAPARDVPYVPTDEPVVAAMLRFAAVTSSDVVYDLGCGDGRIVIAAARHYGARGIGVDIDPARIAECRENAAKARVGDRVRFLCQSFSERKGVSAETTFDTDLREATVTMLYLLPGINVKLRPKLMSELRPGARILSNHFEIGDWKPDMTADVHHRTLRQWIVPAWVAGTWNCVMDGPQGRRRFTLRLRRHYQVVTGSAKVGRDELPIHNGRIFGDQLSFKLIHWQDRNFPKWFNCQVDGHNFRGACRAEAVESGSIPWGGIRE